MGGAKSPQSLSAVAANEGLLLYYSNTTARAGVLDGNTSAQKNRIPGHHAINTIMTPISAQI